MARRRQRPSGSPRRRGRLGRRAPSCSDATALPVTMPAWSPRAARRSPPAGRVQRATVRSSRPTSDRRSARRRSRRRSTRSSGHGSPGRPRGGPRPARPVAGRRRPRIAGGPAREHLGVEAIGDRGPIDRPGKIVRRTVPVGSLAEAGALLLSSRAWPRASLSAGLAGLLPGRFCGDLSGMSVSLVG